MPRLLLAGALLIGGYLMLQEQGAFADLSGGHHGARLNFGGPVAGTVARGAVGAAGRLGH